MFCLYKRIFLPNRGVLSVINSLKEVIENPFKAKSYVENTSFGQKMRLLG